MIPGREVRLAALDASIARGLAEAEAGRTASAAALFDRLEGKYRRQISKKVDCLRRTSFPDPRHAPGQTSPE